MKLENQVAIIVGAGSIGKAIALLFAEEGAKIALVDLMEMKPELERFVKVVKRKNRDVITLTANVTNEKQVNNIVSAVLNKWGRIDILVNCAGYRGPLLPVHKISENEWDKILAINLKAPFICCKVVLNQMLKQKSGNIVNLTGIAGKDGVALRGALCAAKWGITGLTRTIAREAGTSGIRANVIVPGAVADKNLKSTFEKRAKALGTSLEEVERSVLDSNPLSKFAQPEEVAKVALFLASSDSSHTTGEAINVSGGEIMY
jgi:3-oxoacyl-[acyl-carrier protein] reductase